MPGLKPTAKTGEFYFGTFGEFSIGIDNPDRDYLDVEPGEVFDQLGGASPLMARMVAPLNLGFAPGSDEIYQIYRAECLARRHTDPGPRPIDGPHFCSYPKIRTRLSRKSVVTYWKTRKCMLDFCPARTPEQTSTYPR